VVVEPVLQGQGGKVRAPADGVDYEVVGEPAGAELDGHRGEDPFGGGGGPVIGRVHGQGERTGGFQVEQQQ